MALPILVPADSMTTALAASEVMADRVEEEGLRAGEMGGGGMRGGKEMAGAETKAGGMGGGEMRVGEMIGGAGEMIGGFEVGD